MPLPVVSVETIESTLASMSEALAVDDGFDFQEWLGEQEALANLILALADDINKTPTQAFLVGAIMVYKLLKRQAEAEDMAS